MGLLMNLDLMKLDYSLFFTLAAVFLIVFCLVQVLTLKREIPGGVVGKQWTILSWLVVLFTIGYLAAPFFGTIPVETLRLIVSLIFLFGAVYVLITIRLIYRIIQVFSE